MQTNPWGISLLPPKYEKEIVVERPGSPINCRLVDCKYVDPSSHVLLATDVVSPSFEKYTIGFGSQPLRKMGNAGGGPGKNGQGIAILISLETHTYRTFLGYVSIIVASLPTPDVVEPRKVLFVVGGIQTVEKPPINCVEHIHQMGISKPETSVADDSIDDV